VSVFSLESQAFENDEVIPRKYGYKNGNFSPPLKINHIPKNTSSLVLVMDDPDAVGAVGKVWVHWVVWNIDPKINELKENSIPSSCVECETDFGKIGYGGPAPPDIEHTYVFKLYALDVKLDSTKGSTKNQIEKNMKNHIIAETHLKGRYSP
jgi:Raf kinase inhibitor-like YbhB/YbcL family protein